MAKPDKPVVETPRSEPETPSHIVLGTDWRDFLAGRVLKADPDLLAALERDGVSHRPASALERARAGY